MGTGVDTFENGKSALRSWRYGYAPCILNWVSAYSINADASCYFSLEMKLITSLLVIAIVHGLITG
jgi:hypothetical protein